MMKTREELLDRYENEPTANKFSKSDKVLHFTPKELKEVLSAPTEEQMKCEYCHEPFGNLASFRVKGGRQEVYNLSVPSFDGLSNGQLDYDCAHAYQPYGDFRKFDYCPMCARKLGE
ncbi:hypothetical protein FD45_GL000075 [Liquorilactobacillus nagelii DSM 13675]|nr:hypothetical protein FD45_GL000075 [Liquorilactobacillus nagelii DSM 13675]